MWREVRIKELRAGRRWAWSRGTYSLLMYIYPILCDCDWACFDCPVWSALYHQTKQVTIEFWLYISIRCVTDGLFVCLSVVRYSDLLNLIFIWRLKGCCSTLLNFINKFFLQYCRAENEFHLFICSSFKLWSSDSLHRPAVQHDVMWCIPAFLSTLFRRLRLDTTSCLSSRYMKFIHAYLYLHVRVHFSSLCSCESSPSITPGSFSIIYIATVNLGTSRSTVLPDVL